MNTAYDNLMRQLYGNNNPNIAMQKTPDQIALEQKEATYQIFLQSKEGIDAMSDLKSRWEIWYNENYGVKQPVASEDVKDLKDLVLKMTAQNEVMAAKIETLTSQLK